MDATTIINLVKSVTAKWAKQRKAEERQANAVERRREALMRSSRLTIKEAASDVMEAAYLKASANGTLPARPRQIYYQARPPILNATGKETLDGQYFSQTLLVDYMAENPETTASWDIVWDDRGHFSEPHTGKVIGLGTLAVRKYLARVSAGIGDELSFTANSLFPTRGPHNRFQALLFIEKEGFLPLFEAVQLAERFDLAIMSSKGLSTTAARTLVDDLCGHYNIPLLVLHDFDKSGFSIVATLTRDTRRYCFRNRVHMIDLGLRLPDVQKHHLESEYVGYGKSDPAPNLRENGATEGEIAFLCSPRSAWAGYAGQRVELNSFASDSLIAWIESKLKKHGIKKAIPDSATLERAARRAAALAAMPELLAREAAAAEVPAGLMGKVQSMLGDNPALSWDTAVAELVNDK